MSPLPVLMMADGKPGHENQALGLIEAIGRLTPVETERMPVRHGGLAALWKTPPPADRPSLIIGAGHRTHLPMLALSRRTGAPCVVLMKPSLPRAFFDLCILPEHDLRGGRTGVHTLLTKGALNRVPPAGDARRHGGLILLGGPSRAHGWDEPGVREAVSTIVKRGGDRPWRVTDSRRTPAGTLERLSEACPGAAGYPHAATGPEWLPQRLAEAAEVWVTADSVSMIYESLSSGARVGLLPTPLHKPGRVSRGITRLVDEGWITPYERWLDEGTLPEPPGVLREADRCAVLVLTRYFPDRLP